MKIQSDRESDLITEITEGLTDPLNSVSYNLVVPPCFCEERLARAINDRIRQGHPRTPLAFIAMDEICDNAHFIRALQESWIPATTFDSLSRVLSALPAHTHAVLIMRRFHKILDTIPTSSLGALRTAEQQQKIRALVVSPVSHRELKARWSRERPFVVSDYGDIHLVRAVGPSSEKDFLAQCSAHEIPAHMAKLCFSLTGGFPELAESALACWLRMGSPPITPTTRRAIIKEITPQAERFIKWMDKETESKFRRQIVHLYYGIDVQIAEEHLRTHEWQSLLLGPDGLRAELLGMAAVELEFREMARDVNERPGPELLARMSYRSGDFEQATQMFTQLIERLPSASSKLSLAHSRIMSGLLIDGDIGMSSHWSVVAREVRNAKEQFELTWPEHAHRRDLVERYKELLELAEIIQPVKQVRPVDVLCKPDSKGIYNPGRAKAALHLLVVHTENSKRMGRTGAILGLMLPEQILRVWALWRLGIDFEAMPPDHDAVWEDVRAQWSASMQGSLVIPEAGQQFPGFAVFALFVAHAWIKAGVVGNTPESSPQEMSRVVDFLRMRNDAAHAVPNFSQNQADKFIGVAERWLDATIASYPVQGTQLTRRQLICTTKPLPLMTIHGELDWDV